MRVVERETKQTWPQTRNELDDIHLAYLEGEDGSTVLCSELTTAQRRILEALSIPPPKRVRHLDPAPTQA